MHAAIPLNFDGVDPPAWWVGEKAPRKGIGPERNRGLLKGWPNAADVRIAFRVDPAWKRVARVTQLAAIGLARPQETERQRRGVESLLAKLLHDRRHTWCVGNSLVRIGAAARRFCWIGSVLPPYVVQPLRTVVIGLERFVIERPCG
jgi:hypothetical protein